jgi:hypothetical protein
MLGAGGTCEFTAPTECRRPASTSVTGFCACLRSGCSLVRKHLPGMMQRGAARAREPAFAFSAQPDGGAENALSEWRAGCPERASGDGHGQPRAARHAAIPIAHAIGLPGAANVRRRAAVPIAHAIGLPGAANVRRRAAVPIAYAIGLPDGESVWREGMGSPERLGVRRPSNWGGWRRVPARSSAARPTWAAPAPRDSRGRHILRRSPRRTSARRRRAPRPR